jgi:hypothetical protein
MTALARRLCHPGLSQSVRKDSASSNLAANNDVIGLHHFHLRIDTEKL